MAGAERRARLTLASGIGGLVLAGAVGDRISDSPMTAVALIVASGASLIYSVLLRSRIRSAAARQAERNAASARLGWRSLAGVAVSRLALAALLLAAHDPFMIAFVTLLAAAGLLGAVARYRANRAESVTHLLKAGVYGMPALLAYAAFVQDRTDADRVVAELAAYQRQHGHYPERLDALVPALPAIPRPGYGGLVYRQQGEGFSLSYRPSVAGPCAYRSGKDGWDCQSD